MNKKIKDALSVIHGRKSVRHFTGEAVSKSELDILIRAGMAAATAKNMQPWEFIVVTERKTLDYLADSLPYAKMLYKAGAAIIVCAVPELANNKDKDLAIMDCSLASGNIMLAAEAIGLGSVWTAAYPYPDRQVIVRNAIGIPLNVIPLNVIPVGHPQGEDFPKDKYNPAKIHNEKW